jgi:hypothetical protein
MSIVFTHGLITISRYNTPVIHTLNRYAINKIIRNYDANFIIINDYDDFKDYIPKEFHLSMYKSTLSLCKKDNIMKNFIIKPLNRSSLVKNGYVYDLYGTHLHCRDHHLTRPHLFGYITHYQK